MTLDELFAKNQKDLQEAIDREFEQRKTGPKSIRVGPNASLQTIAEETALAAYRRVKHNRAYAVATDPAARLEFGALAIAARQRGVNLVHVMETLATVIPAWEQDRPPDDAGQVPELPIDKITGQRIRNPWLEPHDHKSQHFIKELSPRLARWLQDCEKHGGPTMAMLDELESEKIQAEALRKVQYGEREWQENKLRPGAGATVTEQGEFVKSIEDPSLLQFHRREAAMGAPRARFDNLTARMAIYRRSEKIREVHKAAGEILESWQAEQKEKAA